MSLGISFEIVHPDSNTAWCCILIKDTSLMLQKLDIIVPAAEYILTPPPWKLPTPSVFFSPTSKEDHHPKNNILTFRYLQLDGTAGCAIFSSDMEPLEGDWVGRRLPDHSSSTLCELYGVKDAVSFLYQSELDGVVTCDAHASFLVLMSFKFAWHQ
ncbi:hypothetical protein SK128_014642, partial [Halocaridina rubra]